MIIFYTLRLWIIVWLKEKKRKMSLRETGRNQRLKKVPLISCVFEDHEDQVWATVLWFVTRSLNARLIYGARSLCWDSSLKISRWMKRSQEKQKQSLRLQLVREISWLRVLMIIIIYLKILILYLKRKISLRVRVNSKIKPKHTWH